MNVLKWLSRIFFPSWKFFDETGESPELFVRWEHQDSWTLCSKRVRFQWSQFFLNPQVQRAWALDTLLKKFVSEENPTSTTLAWIENWAKSCLSDEFLGERFQWKVQLASSKDQVYQSPLMDLNHR